MCRLLGYVAAHPMSFVDVLGEEGFSNFTALTAVHGDGWGMAWHEPGDTAAHFSSSPHSAILDPTYDDLARRRLGPVGLVHLRWATSGLAVTPENTHPFVDGGYAFAHNGHISPIPRLERLLTPASRGRLVGDTDSERYFRFVMQCIDEFGNDRDGVTRALGILMREFPTSSLNALMLTPHHSFAVHINSHAVSPLRALRELFASPESIPFRHSTEYFTMDYRVTADAVHIISSGLDEPGWTRVPEDTAVMIDLVTREATRLEPLRED